MTLVKEVTTLMKTTAFLLAVLALVGVMVSSGDALAGTINTNTTSLGSTSFGFAPTAANLKTFTRQTAAGDTFCVVTAGVCVATAQPVTGGGLSCFGTGSLVCIGGNYVPLANSLPGALTSRPDKVVSTNTDFGCGTGVPTGATCVEGPPETGINTMSRVLSDGGNTAPFANSCGAPPCAADGTLTGALNSVVALENLGDVEMPSGSIVFNWTPGVTPGVGLADPNNGSASFTQNISHQVSGLYTFSENDFTNANFLTYASRDLGNVPHNRAAADTAPPLTLGEQFPTMLAVSVRTTLDLTQNTMGGEGTNTESIGYTVDWAGSTFGHPAGGAYFTPGLNIRDWVGNGVPNPTPNPPGDGVGFAN
jgi:hypothetical protein